MTNYIYIFIFFSFFFLSCENQQEPLITSLDFNTFNHLNKLKEINLDTINNYSTLLDEMERNSCNEMTSGIIFSYSEQTFKVVGFTECPTSNEIACYFNINKLYIKNDSIAEGINKTKVSISNLNKILANRVAKPYYYGYDKDKLKPALIFIYFDDSYPIQKTKEVLSKIALEFDSIASLKSADFFPYKLLFQRKYPKLPPPPPQPIIIED